MTAAAPSARQLGAVGRADLALLLARASGAEVAAQAALLGYVPIPAPPRAREHGRAAPTEPAMPLAEGPAVVAEASFPPVPLLQLVVSERHPEVAVAPTPLEEAAPAREIVEPDSRRTLIDALPGPPLAPWSRLEPVLRALLTSDGAGRGVDVPAVVRRLARVEELSRLPRRRARGFVGAVELWDDRSHRVAPFRHDADRVRDRLEKVLGRHAVRRRLLPERDQRLAAWDHGSVLPPNQMPVAGTTVLALSDLGQYGDGAMRQAWRLTAGALRRRGVRVCALTPVPPHRWDVEVAAAWRAEGWERRPVADAPDARVDARAERLLALCAASAWTTLGMLRELRLALPAAEADAGTEADAWNHADALTGCAVALVVAAPARDALRRRFADEPAALRDRVARIVEERHARLHLPELLHGETLVWLHGGLCGQSGDGSEVQPPGDVEQARALVQRFAQIARTGRLDADAVAQVAWYAAELVPQLPPEALADPHIGRPLSVLAALATRVSQRRLPAGPDPATALRELGGPEPPPPRWWTLRHVGDAVVARPGPGPWDVRSPLGGSPLGGIQARLPQLAVRVGDGPVMLVALDGPDPAIRLPSAVRVELVSDVERVVLDALECPEWAVAAGRDRYGLWADAEIRGVVQRFRWVPPGTFLMGSPESEEGRGENEGPQHEVTLTRGYWLGDTPVTQALWEAVRGRQANGSRFQSPSRPVVKVSWYKCYAFLRECARLAPQLAARLPTEFEWEYACRAGASTATWLGDLDIRGEHDAPLLDRIAWYGGNCGRDFMLADGYDIRPKRERQYNDAFGGTHDVAGKAPNPLGLFDMLGNVWEWCSGWLTQYNATASTDPTDTTTGTGKVLRGGAWLDAARNVRAASRGWSDPGYGSKDTGFRLARGHVPAGQGPAARTMPPAEGERSVPGAGGGVRAPGGGGTAAPRTKRRPATDPRRGH
ncbi:MAG: hypothetical protein AMXMBFR64_27790 [Myxococcales bacterium]